MILPTKHIPPTNTLLGVGALLLQHLEKPRTVTFLWENTRDMPGVGTFERFSLALDFLYAVGSIEFDRGLLKRVEK